MNFLENVLNLIFPPTCGICGKSGCYICSECIENIKNLKLIVNRIDKYNDEDKYFDKHLYIFKYENIIRKKIIEYKFGNKPYLFNMFCEFFLNNKKVCGFFKNYDIIVPVPISKKRLKERGYNQSALIANKIGKILNINVENNVLIKVKDNSVQSLLKKEQRLKNVKDVYKVKKTFTISKRRILIFDDIYTTGATANECARVLKKAGAENIGIVTIAKD